MVQRLVLQVALIKKRASALPGERGHLPDLALSEQLNQTVALLGVIGAQQQFKFPSPLTKRSSSLEQPSKRPITCSMLF